MAKQQSIGVLGDWTSTCRRLGIVTTAPTIGQMSQHQLAWTIQNVSQDQRRMYFCGA